MNDIPFPREIVRAVRAWREKQTAQEKRRWDEIWALFWAGRRIPAGTVLPNGKVIIDSHTIYARRPQIAEQ